MNDVACMKGSRFCTYDNKMRKLPGLPIGKNIMKVFGVILMQKSIL